MWHFYFNGSLLLVWIYFSYWQQRVVSHRSLQAVYCGLFYTQSGYNKVILLILDPVVRLINIYLYYVYLYSSAVLKEPADLFKHGLRTQT